MSGISIGWMRFCGLGVSGEAIDLALEFKID